jgi:predicted ABC-type ATPase
MATAQLWMVAGPNGAGKTTCTQRKPIANLLPKVTFYNPDDRTLAKLRTLGYQGFADAPVDVQASLFFESADEVFRELSDAVSQRRTVGVETVLSSSKYCTLVEAMLDAKGFFGLIYVALSSPSIARDRVAWRTKGANDFSLVAAARINMEKK